MTNLGDVVRYKGRSRPDDNMIVMGINNGGLLVLLTKSNETISDFNHAVEMVEPGLVPGTIVTLRQHPVDDDGKMVNWNEYMALLVGSRTTVRMLSYANFFDGRFWCYYQVEGSWCSWLRQALEPVLDASCQHVWINVGFASVRMACKHCGADQP